MKSTDIGAVLSLGLRSLCKVHPLATSEEGDAIGEEITCLLIEKYPQRTEVEICQQTTPTYHRSDGMRQNPPGYLLPLSTVSLSTVALPTSG